MINNSIEQPGDQQQLRKTTRRGAHQASHSIHLTNRPPHHTPTSSQTALKFVIREP